MGMKRAVILFVVMCVLCLVQSAPCGGPAPGHTYVLLVQGISRDPADRREKEQALHALRGFWLARAGVDPRRLVMLQTSAASSKAQDTEPTAHNLRRALEAFASRIQPQDRFNCHYLGQANAVGGALRLNLPGPDITDTELADWLRGIPANRQFIVLDCPCAGLAARTLTAEGRILVCAATAKQAYATRFTSALVQVLGRPATDLDGDGKLSLLEAFTATAREIEAYYRRQQILATETPSLEDNGDGVASEQPWRYQTEPGDGAGAAAFVLAEGH